MTSPRSSIRVSPVFDPGSGGLPLVSELTPVFVSGYDLGRTVSSTTTIGFSRCVRLWLLATALQGFHDGNLVLNPASTVQKAKQESCTEGKQPRELMVCSRAIGVTVPAHTAVIT